MSRREFTKATKRAAWERSAKRCEARGTWYGLDEGRRCDMPLDRGVEFDHIDLDANSKDNSLENCAAVCKRCHHIKTTKRDIPIAAKTQRQQDKDVGIKGRKGALSSSKFKRRMDGTVVLRDVPYGPAERRT